MKTIKQVLGAVSIVVAFATNAQAAVYDLALTAVGGAYNGQTLWQVDPFNPPNFISNLSSIEVAESILWGIGGTTGTFNAVGIEINYFGTAYTLADALAPVTVEWLDGQMVAINYETADFYLDINASYNTKEWTGSVIVSEIPVPAAWVLFMSALSGMGLVARKSRR